MALFNNYPLLSALASIVLAQTIKVPLNFIANRKWDFKLVYSSGGMPSSHSAAVSSLTAAIGLSEGVRSPLFAIAVVMSVIIMFDAAGVRRQAGEQAVVLNRMVMQFQHLFQEAITLNTLKELLGHKPGEVFVGAIFGVAVSFAGYYLIYHG